MMATTIIMRANSPKLLLSACITLLATLAACSESSTGPDGPSGNPNAASIDEFFAALPSWPTQPAEKITDGANNVNIVFNPGDNLDYRCESTPKTHIKPFDRIAAAGMDEDVIWPGAILQGGSVESGTPKALLLPRSSVTVRVDVPIANQSRVVEAPNSVSMGQAISDLIREIADQQGSLDPVRSEIDFQVTEASSFEQSMLSMGVGGGFKEPYSGINVEGNIEGSIDRAMTTHSAVVLLSQEMFTISFADDLPSADSASELFANSLTVDDLNAKFDSGDIGDDNVPVYVKSVTYGRLLIASIKSTSVSSGAKLAASMGASYEDYGGSGELSAEQREILENSSWQYSIFGGSQDAADNAIGSLDWSQYFTPTLATTAVPLRFELLTMNDREPAGIHDTVEYEVRGNCMPPRAYEMTTTLSKVELAAGNCFTPCEWEGYLRTNSGGIFWAPFILNVGLVSNANPVKHPGGSKVVDLGPGTRLQTVGEFTLTPWVGTTQEFSYPFPEFKNNVARAITVKVNSSLTARRCDFTFVFKKKALY